MTQTVLFFDIDNTLYDHEKTFEAAMKDCFTEMYGASAIATDRWFPIFKKYCDRYWPQYEDGHLTRDEYQYIRLSESLSVFQLPTNPTSAKQLQQRYERIISKFMIPFPGVREFFELAYRNEQKIGIITNGSSATQRRKLESLAITKWICNELVIISGEQTSEKPDHIIFKTAEKKANVTKDLLLYVGDSWDLDIVPAIELGWNTVFLNTRNERQSTVHEPLTEYRSFQEVASFLINYLSLI